MRLAVFFASTLLACGGAAAREQVARPGEVLVVGKTGGCGNVFAWRAASDGKRFLTIRVDAKGAGLSPGGSRRFDLAGEPKEIVVQLETFPNAPADAPYCATGAHDTAEVWKAEAGVVTVDLEASPPPDTRFHATLRARDLRFRSADGSRVFVPTVTIDDVIVGWNPS
ncbi:MAG TPA: hypothetical protein VIF62_19280 [Labilithrix sp.]|jgi:hypothetical protein